MNMDKRYLIIPIVGLMIVSIMYTGMAATMKFPDFTFDTKDQMVEAMCKDKSWIGTDLCNRSNETNITAKIEIHKTVEASKPILSIGTTDLPGCIQMKDRDGVGYTKCTTLKGVLTCEIGKC
jgi:hypothetical protein